MRIWSLDLCFLYIILFFLHLFILFYLFLAAFGLRCCARAFSSCGERGLLCGARASVVVARGLSSCSSRALEHRLSSCGARAELLCGMWDLPGPGLEPVSPALAGGFSTTVPPGNPLVYNSIQSHLGIHLLIRKMYEFINLMVYL